MVTDSWWKIFYISFQFAKQKASELEDYQSISLSGTDLEGSDEPAVKKRKLAKEVQESTCVESQACYFD